MKNLLPHWEEWRMKNLLPHWEELRMKNEEWRICYRTDNCISHTITQISQILKKTKKTCDETRDKSRETIDKIMMEWYNEILKENQENLFCVVKAKAFCANDISFSLWAWLTDKRLYHHHSPNGTNHTKRKTKKTISIVLVSYLILWRLRIMVFSVFLFCCLSRKAVFDMAVREGKFTWNLWRTDWKRMSETHKQQKRVFIVFFMFLLFFYSDTMLSVWEIQFSVR